MTPSQPAICFTQVFVKTVRPFFATGDEIDAIFILFAAGATIGASILILILVLLGCRFQPLRWIGWTFIAVGILWSFGCYFSIEHFTTPDPWAIFEAMIPLSVGIITVYVLSRSRSKSELVRAKGRTSDAETP
jgi:hypothetical protein